MTGSCHASRGVQSLTCCPEQSRDDGKFQWVLQSVLGLSGQNQAPQSLASGRLRCRLCHCYSNKELNRAMDADAAMIPGGGIDGCEKLFQLGILFNEIPMEGVFVKRRSAGLPKICLRVRSVQLASELSSPKSRRCVSLRKLAVATVGSDDFCLCDDEARPGHASFRCIQNRSCPVNSLLFAPWHGALVWGLSPWNLVRDHASP